MSTPDPMRSVPQLALPQQPFTEFRSRVLPGVPVLLGGVAAVAAGAALFAAHPGGASTAVLDVLGVLLIVAGAIGLGGLTPVTAGEARVVQLFGRYQGTVRQPGLCWVNPFTRR